MAPIVESAALAAFCARVSRSSYVTVDTEFMRDKTYYPQLCLVQVAGDEDAAVIDSLAPGIDLSPLLALMDNPAVLKVFHAARQDLEIFHNLTGRVPAPLFDTQVAAALAGHPAQVGYAELVRRLLERELPKAHTRTDWSRRPLAPEQIEYALDDVRYLLPLQERLTAEIESLGRAEWLAEELAALTTPAGVGIDPELAWQRFK
ncbi:MAG: ribonuclease D, partial [Alphaproteobacteria bacterium]